MTPTFYFLKNLLDTELTLKSGYLCIKPRGFARLTENDTKDESVPYALNKGWAEFVDEAPDSDGVEPAAIKFEITDPFEGLTIEELKAEQAKAEQTKTAEETTSDTSDAPVKETKTKTKKAA